MNAKENEQQQTKAIGKKKQQLLLNLLLCNKRILHYCVSVTQTCLVVEVVKRERVAERDGSTNPPKNKRFISLNPDRKCPGQWGQMLSKETPHPPFLLPLLKEAPLTKCHLETVTSKQLHCRANEKTTG